MFHFIFPCTQTYLAKVKKCKEYEKRCKYSKKQNQYDLIKQNQQNNSLKEKLLHYLSNEINTEKNIHKCLKRKSMR